MFDRKEYIRIYYQQNKKKCDEKSRFYRYSHREELRTRNRESYHYKKECERLRGILWSSDL